jgi:predicted nucleic acid-binding protein
VALVYFDSSALVKLVVEERGSELAARLWNECDAAVSCRLARVEVSAALAASARNGVLGPAELLGSQHQWQRYWAYVRPVELTTAVGNAAAALAAEHALRGADAVHLASALAVPADDVVIAVWDRRLHAGARRAGLAVAPAKLPM